LNGDVANDSDNDMLVLGDAEGAKRDDHHANIEDVLAKGGGNVVHGPRGSFMIADDVCAGYINDAFESAPLARMTKRLLRFLKHHKKMHANRTLELTLPDWKVDPAEFSPPAVAITVGAGEKVPPPRPSKRRRLSSAAVPVAGEDGIRVDRVKESQMYKSEKDADGNVVFPIPLGVLTIENLGEVDRLRSTFHTDRTIYPIGYRALREYTSMVNVERTCSYVCEILDNGEEEGAPVFRVTCMDQPDTPFNSASPSGCWTNVLTAVRDATPADRKRSYVNVSGPEYFGLTNALVQELVQDLPGADSCHKYVRITFIASTKRHHGRGGRSAAGRAASDRRQLAAAAASVENGCSSNGVGARTQDKQSIVGRSRAIVDKSRGVLAFEGRASDLCKGGVADSIMVDADDGDQRGVAASDHEDDDDDADDDLPIVGNGTVVRIGGVDGS
jgi:F/Y rich C-terminus/F/Y-rich N-terminus